MSDSPPLHSLVPRPTPALILSRGEDAGWRIDTIAPSLAEAATGQSRGALARTARAVFPQAEPSLGSLADRCLRDGRSLQQSLRLLPDLPPLLAVFRPLSPTDDGRQQVAVWFGEAASGVEGATTFHDLVGRSSVMQALFERIRLYGRADAPVVITGETGTGKELVARALHEESRRNAQPYVALNCSAISEELLESELFGHEKGAFTGAIRSHRGRFERAHHGTLFLDEIGDMPLHTQTRLLRVLEEGVIERVGGEREQKVDVRVLCATHVPLEEAVAGQRFRGDLYHRLAVLRLHLPPLRERLDDLPLLIHHFLARFAEKYRRPPARLTPEALALLQAYLWPGNVRELRNVLERVFVETAGEVIGARAFGDWVRERQAFAPLTDGGRSVIPLTDHGRQPLLSAPEPGILDAELMPSSRRGVPAHLTESALRAAYRQAGGNLTQAARLLGVHRATVYRYLQRLGLDREDLA